LKKREYNHLNQYDAMVEPRDLGFTIAWDRVHDGLYLSRVFDGAEIARQFVSD